MPAALFLGDEATAAGFRLAGVATVDASRDDAPAAFAQACRDASLVIVSASFAARLPEAVLARARTSAAHFVAVIPDLNGEAAVPDVAARIYAELGLETPGAAGTAIRP
jgi:vacuolar-type H+-ATPase subunit F/Vma7